MSEYVIVIGASSAIAQSVIKKLLEQGQSVLAISRSEQPDDLMATKWLQVDCSDQCIAETCADIAQQGINIRRVLMFHGLLHNADMFPEKQIRELKRTNLLTLFEANAVVPMLWLQGLAEAFKRQKHPVVISVCSARVGSISDNRLGGWYGYRASKAALNMLLKTLAIEFKRTLPHVKLMAFHPGTTDTPLSEPFQQRVPEGKLFTPEFVAEQLLTIIENLTPDGELAYLDWSGEKIDW